MITFQQQARRRKLIYFGLIALLLTLQMQHRQFVERTAEENDLRETNIGQVDLGGSAARFALTSFRGPLICALWWEATERQKRNEWNQLELLIRTLAKLQPHFKGPWRFQAWNLAFNVSVEFDRVQDKYFYIAEGTKWLAEGEHINRSRMYDAETGQKKVIGDPDLRNEIAFMFQDKMNLADEARIFRCFLPLSCITPDNWDPLGKLSPARNPEELKRFKAQFPQWTRRFRELRRIPEAADAYLNQEILAFLGEQREAYRQGRFPSLFHFDPNTQRDDDADQPFPIWPVPESEEGPFQRLRRPGNPENEGMHNSFEIARNWYEYSIAPLPPPEGRPFTEVSANEKKYYRQPKRMVTLIFRKQPAQAKSKEAESFGEEGWFDKTDMESANARDTWRDAARMWLDFGRDNALEANAEKVQNWEKVAMNFIQKHPDLARPRMPPPAYMLKDPEVAEGYRAFNELVMLNSMKKLANYDHWKLASETNATPEAMQAHRYFYNAARRRSDLSFADNQYELGLAAWENILTKPRKMNGTDLRFLLCLGPVSPLGVNCLFQQDKLFEITPIGNDHQTQEELLEKQDGYLRVRARLEAPSWLYTGVSLWELERHLTNCASGPCLGSALAAGIPSVPVPIALDELVMMLEVRPTRLDKYMSPELVAGRGLRAERVASRPPAMPQGGIPIPQPGSMGGPGMPQPGGVGPSGGMRPPKMPQ